MYVFKTLIVFQNQYNNIQNQYMKEIISKTFNRNQSTQKLTFKESLSLKKKLAVFEPKPPLEGFRRTDAIPLV